MKTKKNKQKPKDRSFFLVLVPHQEARANLRKNFNSLVENGLKGVYDFPFVSPLACLSRPLNTDELKTIAHSLRETLGSDKITANDYCSLDFPINSENMALYGPRLSLSIPKLQDNEKQKIMKLFSPIIIGTCFLQKDNEQKVRVNAEGMSSCGSWLKTQLSFRAAAVANMFWQPCRINEELCFKWKIGKLVWLPKKPRLPKKTRLPKKPRLPNC